MDNGSVTFMTHCMLMGYPLLLDLRTDSSPADRLYTAHMSYAEPCPLVALNRESA